MFHRALALLLALSLSLGATASLVAAGCAATSAAALSDAANGCGTCDGTNGNGQVQQGCAALTCSAGCISGPVTGADGAERLLPVTAIEKAVPAQQDAMLARPIPPDHPPPR